MTVDENIFTHLQELRKRLLFIILGWLFVFCATVPFSHIFYTWLARPLLTQLPAGGQLIATSVVAPFLVPIKLVAVLSFLLSFPNTLYQIWRFVAPGLYVHEKKLMSLFMVVGSVLFLTGITFAYGIVLPLIFKFILHVVPYGVVVMTDISYYFDFVMTLFISFGLAFEIPIMILVMVYFLKVEVSLLKQIRPYVVVGIFIISAIVTPPDVLSQLLLAIPMCFLYELGILWASCISRRHSVESVEKTLESKIHQD